MRSFFSHPISRAIGLIFALEGALYGTWSALIPYVKDKFQLDEAELGLLLLSLPAGVTLMNPVSVPILERFGPVRASIVSLAVAAVLFIFPIGTPVLWVLVVSLFAAGAAFSSTNVAMNTCASMLEMRDKSRIMSTCHGLWSTGAMTGSALGGMTTGWGLAALWHVIIVGAVVLLASFFLSRPMHPLEVYAAQHQPAQEGASPIRFSWPNAALWGLIGLSLCTNLVEGTMADWAAVYMREIVQAAPALTGWGFGAYAFWMASGRFAGDALLTRYGNGQVLGVGGAMVVFGLLLAVFLPYTWVVLLGFALVGAGVSLGAPILYAAAARVPGMAPGAGLATMNTFAMIGFLGGPALVGFMAKAFSLPVAFGAVAFAALLLSLCAKTTDRLA